MIAHAITTGEKQRKTPIGIAATLQNLSITAGKDAWWQRLVKESFRRQARALSVLALNK
jgi:hypothetical protein